MFKRKNSKKPPKNGKPVEVEKQQKISDVFAEAADAEFAEDSIDNNDIELDTKESMIVKIFKIASDSPSSSYSQA